MQNLSNRALAKQLMQKNTPEQIIKEVFCYFSTNCKDICNLNPEQLDESVRKVLESEENRLENLIELIALLRRATDGTKERHEFIKRVLEYLDAHLCDNISIEQMAKDLHISYCYMSHLFREEMWTTLSSYRNRKRVCLAVQKLLHSEDKISDIALSCGYEGVSYFTEMFTKFLDVAPSEFREKRRDTIYFPYYDEQDRAYADMLGLIRLAEGMKTVENPDAIKTYPVQMPDEYIFLHEAAIIEYHKTLFASWYNNAEHELNGRTPIRSRRSTDGGKTWSEIEVIADDPTGEILYCPPVYGICEDKLYMLINEMVAPDHIHALDLFVYDPEKDGFVMLWSKPIPFKLNTNVVALENGKLMLPGRVGELDRFPNTPAVLISDSGKIDGDWRLVRIAPNGELADGEKLIHPEISAVVDQEKIYMFCRNDQRRVSLLYLSEDNGEHWSEPYTTDLPIGPTKMYAGTLSDGRNYLVANETDNGRKTLVLYLTQKGSMQFEKRIVLRDGEEEGYPGSTAWHYPVACEGDGKIYIIYTVNFNGWEKRGAVLSVVDLKKI